MLLPFWAAYAISKADGWPDGRHPLDGSRISLNPMRGEEKDMNGQKAEGKLGGTGIPGWPFYWHWGR